MHSNFVFKFTVLCSQAYSTASSCFSATLNIHCIDSSDYPSPQKYFGSHFHGISLPLPFPAHGNRQQQKPSHLSPIFVDLFFLGFIDECFLANLQSHNSTRTVGNGVDWGSDELNRHRRLSIHKGEIVFSL